MKKYSINYKRKRWKLENLHLSISRKKNHKNPMNNYIYNFIITKKGIEERMKIATIKYSVFTLMVNCKDTCSKN